MHWQRDLTGMERWLWLFDRAAPMNMVFVAHVAGRFDRERLGGALAAAAERCPVLTARIEPDDRPRFVATDRTVPVARVAREPDTWREIAVEEANRRVPAGEGPLARAVLIDGEDRSELILTIHQAALDGPSALQLIDQILSVHGGGPLCALTAAEVIEPPGADLLGSRSSALAATLREIPKMRRLSPLPESRSAPPEQRRTGLISARLPAARIMRLAGLAGEHGTSVHGAIAAALLLAIGTELRAGRHNRRHLVGCATTLDVRRRADLPPSYLGNFVSRLVSAHSVHYDALFWDLAAEVSGALRHATARGTALAYARLKEAKAIGVSDARLGRRVRKSERFNRAAAIINNLGRSDAYGGYGDVQLERLDFLVSANAYVGSALVLSAVTRGDHSTFNFTFAEPLLAPEVAQRVVDEFVVRLDAAIGGREGRPVP